MMIIYTKNNGGIFGMPKTKEYFIVNADDDDRNSKDYGMKLYVEHEWYATSIGDFFPKKGVPIRKVLQYLEEIGYERVPDSEVDDILQDLEEFYGIM